MIILAPQHELERRRVGDWQSGSKKTDLGVWSQHIWRSNTVLCGFWPLLVGRMPSRNALPHQVLTIELILLFRDKSRTEQSTSECAAAAGFLVMNKWWIINPWVLHFFGGSMYHHDADTMTGATVLSVKGGRIEAHFILFNNLGNHLDLTRSPQRYYTQHLWVLDAGTQRMGYVMFLTHLPSLSPHAVVVIPI